MDMILKKGDGTMAAVSKPVNGAFVLDKDKASLFFSKKMNTSSDALGRFESRKRKAGKVTSENKK